MIKAAHPFKIGSAFIERGETGRLATIEEARKLFPNIDSVLNSPFIAVVFKDLPPCIVLRRQIDLNPD